MSKVRTEPLRTFPEDAETPAPVVTREPPPVPEAAKAEEKPEPFRFDMEAKKAWARDADGKMVAVKFEPACMAANDAGSNAAPEILLRTAASVAMQHPLVP